MPAKDKYHDVVIRALQKEGWTIISEQITLNIGKRRLWIDLKAKNLQQQVILLEVKSYDSINSPIYYFQQAIGQYLMYRAILDAKYQENVVLYLALPTQAHVEIIQTKLGRLIVETYKINLVVYDVDQEVITTWINNA